MCSAKTTVTISESRGKLSDKRHRYAVTGKLGAKMPGNPVQKLPWQMVLDVLQSGGNPHGYSVSDINTAISERFAAHVSKHAIRRYLAGGEFTGLGLQCTVHRVGPRRTPVNFYHFTPNK